MTDQEHEIYRTLLKCQEKLCIYGFECPYSKYDCQCVRYLLNDAANTIKSMDKSRENV